MDDYQLKIQDYSNSRLNRTNDNLTKSIATKQKSRKSGFYGLTLIN